MAISGTVSVEAPSPLVAHELLRRFGLGAEVETHGTHAPIDLRIPFDSDEDLRMLLRDLRDAMLELGVPALRVSLGERSILLEV